MGKPKIRFKGYEDDWEQRKLSDIYASIGNAFVGTATPYYVESGHFYLESNNIKDGQINHNSEIFINDEFYEKQKDKWLHTGDMVMVQSGHVGHAAVIPEELDNSAAHALIMFRHPKEKIEPYFLNYQYQTNKSKKKIEEITTGNTIKHILASDMQEFVVDITNYDEQKKIGSYFQKLDHLITLHQRKCEETKSLKKYMLQKMFPENGNCVPKIRFSGFADAWEQRKLGEVAQEFKSGNSLKADEIDITGDYPVYGGNGLRGYTSTYNHDGEYALIGRQGALCGNMNYSVGKAYFTEHAVVVKADENNDTRFLYYMLDTMNLGQYSDQSAQPGLAVNKLVKLENQFPMKEEQQRIGWYFSNIDHLITLHQHKCDELQKLKKFMLQNMFV
ncbi:restriction endonuclease subunit S [Roseburia faecis]|jgi:type I restriction enzyme S subunit|uniref:Type I restriction enzyme specificity protein MG438 n=1 Tax=Roseburia faecis TaxID=301302 RepID=A0A173S238_9FIRM|nr:restriction endonuclease subunit S [Roseburia faecis]CUM83819.1 Type I restriction enzyme specificity protein MG438 [Roseburia faecis]